MKDSRVLGKLYSKARCQTKSVVLCPLSTKNNKNSYKYKKLRFLYDFVFTLVFIQSVESSLLQHLIWASVLSPSVKGVSFNRYLWKQRLWVNDITNHRALSLRSLTSFSHKWKFLHKDQIIRPLLDLKRETITIVCKDLRLPVYPDQSNRSVQYSRNRIRKQVIPSIKYFLNPQVENSLFKLAELLNKEQFFLYSILRNMSCRE